MYYFIRYKKGVQKKGGVRLNNGESIWEWLKGYFAFLFLGGVFIFFRLANMEMMYLGIDFSIIFFILGIGIIGFGIYLFSSDIYQNLNTEESKIAKFVAKNQVEELKQKYLAVAAVYYNSPYEAVYCLNSYLFRSKRETENWRKAIERSWGMTDTASARNTLDWLQQAGHRKSANFKSNLENYVAQVTSKELTNPETKEFIETVKSIYLSKEIGYIKEAQIYTCHNIAAWDYLRGLNLARIAYNLGYLKEEEAWFYIEAFGMKVKQDFNSWEEVAVSFLLGRYIWSEDPDQQEFANHFTSLFSGGIEESESIWQQQPFATL